MDISPPAELSQPTALCRLDDIPDGGATAVDAVMADGEESLILLRRGDQVHGYLNVCPHAGRRLDYAPGKFLLKSDTLICAVHGATFNQGDGLCIAGPCRGEHLRTVTLQVDDGEVRLA
ncbi:Rieske (2Fe-2S) protein [Rhodanobacter ginsengiterrae]|uniref:Rieske (2Fe-2S) protein n=1 Tax=Rhodanobacter ginsengiterrae TaxID=2008451 RepID=UPI003CF59810